MRMIIEFDGQKVNLEPCPFVKQDYSSDGWYSSCAHPEGAKQNCTYGIRIVGGNYSITNHAIPNKCPLISKKDLSGIITIN